MSSVRSPGTPGRAKSTVMLVGSGVASVLPVFALALLAPACANGTDADTGAGEETKGDASTSGRGDSSVIAPDKDGGGGGNGPNDGAAEGGGGGPSGCTTKLVINEVLVEGTNNAEFVELYNPNACDVDFSGWELRYLPKSPASTTDGTAFFKAGNGATLKGGKFYLLGAGDIGVTPDKTFNGTLGNAGGQIALVDESGSIVDAVGWGATGKYTEGTAARIATPGKSIGRHPDGADTDDNQSDFVEGDVTPGASNGS